MDDDGLRRRLLDQRYAETVRRLDAGEDPRDGIRSASTPLLAAVLRNRAQLRARLEDAAWRAASAGDMASRTERFLNLRAQYASLSDAERGDLVAVYLRLLGELRGVVHEADADVGPALDAATGHHLDRLMAMIESTRDGGQLAAAARGEVSHVCAAYRPHLQLAILGVTTAELDGPVLDIGAGASGALVAHLRERGVEATGIDRLAAPGPNLLAADWLEYAVGSERWGTIISHMGFSNHFLRHHRHGDQVALRYATRFMELLNGLRPGGRFLYAPSLPFLERLLSRSAWAVRRTPVPGGPPRDHARSHATAVTRL